MATPYWGQTRPGWGWGLGGVFITIGSIISHSLCTHPCITMRSSSVSTPSVRTMVVLFIGISITFVIYGQFMDAMGVYWPPGAVSRNGEMGGAVEWRPPHALTHPPPAARYEFFVLYIIGFVIQAFTGIACLFGFVRSWSFSLRSVIPFTVFRNYHNIYGTLHRVISITFFIYGQFKYEVEDEYWQPLTVQDLEYKVVRPTHWACYKFYVLSMIGFAIQTCAGIACLIVFVWPWGFLVSFPSPSSAAIIPRFRSIGPLRSGSAPSSYKFFVLYMIGFVIHTFAGIVCSIVSMRPWGFSLRSVTPFTVVRHYHTTYLAASLHSGFGRLSCPPYSKEWLQVLCSLHDWSCDPDICGYRLLDRCCVAVGIHSVIPFTVFRSYHTTFRSFGL